MTSSADGGAGTAAEEYNRIFESLVDGPDDLVGMIAYGRYKWAKREWIQQQCSEMGRSPGPAAMKSYAAHWTDSQLGSLNETAESALSEFTLNILQSEAPRIEAEALKQAQSFWTDVWAGVVGAFAYTLLLIAFAIILRIAGVDLVDIIRAAPELTSQPKTMAVVP